MQVLVQLPREAVLGRAALVEVLLREPHAEHVVHGLGGDRQVLVQPRLQS